MGLGNARIEHDTYHDDRHRASHLCHPVIPPPRPPLAVFAGSPVPPFLSWSTPGWGVGCQHWSPSLGVSPWGGRCLHSPSGCNTIVRAVHLYPLRTNGHTLYPSTLAVPHTGVRYTVGHRRSPCGADVSLAGPDGRCALPAAPHWARTAVRAVGSAPCQAHWPPPGAGATMGRYPPVLGVSRLLAAAQAGPIRSPGPPPNPAGQVPCRRPPVGIGCSFAGPRCPHAFGARLPRPSSPLLGSVSAPPHPASRVPIAPCVVCVRRGVCWLICFFGGGGAGLLASNERCR